MENGERGMDAQRQRAAAAPNVLPTSRRQNHCSGPASPSRLPAFAVQLFSGVTGLTAKTPRREGNEELERTHVRCYGNGRNEEKDA